MLAAGARYDPRLHADQSRPVAHPVLVDAPSGTLKRRMALDGTPYCCCCDTVLAPAVGRGRPPSTCPECRSLRRRLKRAAFEATRSRDRRRLPGGATRMGRADPTRVDASEPVVPNARPTYEVIVRQGMPSAVRDALEELSKLVDSTYKDFPAHHAATPEGRLLRHSRALAAWYRHLYKEA